MCGDNIKNFSVDELCRVYIVHTKNSGTLRYVFISSPTTFARQLSRGVGWYGFGTAKCRFSGLGQRFFCGGGALGGFSDVSRGGVGGSTKGVLLSKTHFFEISVKKSTKMGVPGRKSPWGSPIYPNKPPDDLHRAFLV